MDPRAHVFYIQFSYAAVLLSVGIRLSEDPDDEQAKVDLCWAYLENERDEEAAEVFATMNKDNAPPFDYYNLLATLTYSSKDYRRGIEALEKLIEIIDELPEDSEKNITRKKRKGEMYGRVAYFYHMLKDDDAMIQAQRDAIPEFKRFNIIECEVRNAV